MELGLGEIATEVGAFIVNLFQSLASIFYTAPTTSGSTTTPGSLTIYGYLLLFAAVVAIAVFLVNWVRSLFNIKRA